MARRNCHKIFFSQQYPCVIAHVNIAVFWHLESNNIGTRSPAGTLLLEILSLFIDIVWTDALVLMGICRHADLIEAEYNVSFMWDILTQVERYVS